MNNKKAQRVEEKTPLLQGGAAEHAYAYDYEVDSKPAAYQQDEVRLRLDGQDDHQMGGGAERSPIALTWQNVQYVIKSSSGPPWKRTHTEKVILRDVAGCARPGELTAIVGASGAGKSSLLDVLAGRKNSGTLTGEVLLNGRPRDRSFKRLSAYVTQDDCLMGSQTVFETLMFRANLQLPSETWTHEQRVARVNEVISELGLEKVRDSKIGTQFDRGISGGEKKRVSIGCELVTNPSLVFADEPSTGLDAFNSLATLEALSRIAKNQNRTVICTIHQPRSNIFDLFDQLVVLSLGEVVYAGPAVDALPFFARITSTVCPTRGNPADHIVDLVLRAEKNDPLDASGTLAPQPLPLLYQQSPACAAKREQIQQLGEEFADVEVVPEGGLRRGSFATSWPRQCWHVTGRAASNLLRNPLVTRVQVFQNVFMGLLVGSIYFQMPQTDQEVQDRLGALFFMITSSAFGQMSSLNNFILGRELFSRERAAGVYQVSVFFIAQNLIELPVAILFPSIMGTIAYWMMGLQPDAAKFFIFLLTLIIFTATATSLYALIGAASPNAAVAQIIAPLTIVLFFLFAGFYVNANNIPDYYIWLYYVSFFRYGYQNLVSNEFTGMVMCEPSPTCPEPTGEVVLKSLGFDDVNLVENALILVSMVLIYRALAYLSLVMLQKEKR